MCSSSVSTGVMSLESFAMQSSRLLPVASGFISNITDSVCEGPD